MVAGRLDWRAEHLLGQQMCLVWALSLEPFAVVVSVLLERVVLCLFFLFGINGLVHFVFRISVRECFLYEHITYIHTYRTLYDVERIEIIA